jgi:hypothetical protein
VNLGLGRWQPEPRADRRRCGWDEPIGRSSGAGGLRTAVSVNIRHGKTDPEDEAIINGAKIVR